VLGVSIQINNSSLAKDAIVRVKCDHPAQTFTANCTIGLTGHASGPVTVVLTNPDGRLRFPLPADTTKKLDLPASGTTQPFVISGERATATKGDAKIQGRLTSATGKVLTETPVTVFSFDQAQILVTLDGNFVWLGDRYTCPPGHPAVRFSSTARLRP